MRSKAGKPLVADQSETTGDPRLAWHAKATTTHNHNTVHLYHQNLAAPLDCTAFLAYVRDESYHLQVHVSICPYLPLPA